MDYNNVKIDVTLPEPGDDTNTICFNCLVDFDLFLGDNTPDKWTGETLETEIIFNRIQIEISDSVWADLNIDNYSSVEEQLSVALVEALKELGEI